MNWRAFSLRTALIVLSAICIACAAGGAYLRLVARLHSEIGTAVSEKANDLRVSLPREYVRAMLQELGDDAPLDQLAASARQSLYDADAHKRLAAAMILGELRPMDDRSVAALLDAKKDPDPRVRLAAEESLEYLAATPAEEAGK